MHEILKTFPVHDKHLAEFRRFHIHREAVLRGIDKSRCQNIGCLDPVDGELLAFGVLHLCPDISLHQNKQRTAHVTLTGNEFSFFIRAQAVRGFAQQLAERFRITPFKQAHPVQNFGMHLSFNFSLGCVSHKLQKSSPGFRIFAQT